ncbi:MAG TPA: hypothetical protein VLC91_14010 [Spongiibacteraceae bacterium]|nr:hypothetical protein [Spongiibacteraceae bacterium]
MLSLLQHHSDSVAEKMLARWLPPGVAKIAVQHMQSFAHALTTTRLVMPLRHCEAVLLNMAPRADLFHSQAAVH